MTNAEIIFRTSEDLVKQGILKTVEIDGMIVPEIIHTFQKWKSLGYSVKKGEKAIAKFPIWKHSSKKVVDEETNEENEKTSMFMKMASFFKFEQVEKIERKAV